MSRLPAHRSLFSQKLDAAIFASYFMGAVVPMLALGWVVQRYALPAVETDAYSTAVLIGSLLAIGLLSLVAFFALRRISRDAMARMDADNERLQAILEASRALAEAPHAHVAMEVAAGCALRMTSAGGVLVLQAGDVGKPLELREAAGKGAQAFFQQYEEEIVALAADVLASAHTSAVEPLGQRAGVAIPMVAEGRVTGAFVVLAADATSSRTSSFEPAVIDAFSTLAGLAGVAVSNAELRDSQQNFFTHATEILVSALDAHVAARVGRADQVAELANRLGRQLELEEASRRRLHFAALLHDIGMLKLSDRQQQNSDQLARHPVLGHRMLSGIRLWQPLAEIVLHHHDAFDGAAREGGRTGESIPLESRIIHLADVYVGALQTGGADPQRASAEARRTITCGRGTRFDPAVVDAFERLVGEGHI